MKLKQIFISVSIFLVLFLTLFTDRLLPGSGAGSVFEQSFFAMGSMVTQKIYGYDAGQAAELAQSAIERLDRTLLSRNVTGSDIARINAAAGISSVEAHPETIEYLRFCLELADETGGAFNPLLGALSDLWGIGGANPRVPPPEEIAEALPLCDYTRVEIDGGKVFLPLKGMSFDLGAVGKGGACDAAAEAFDGQPGVTGAVVSVGGNILTVGQNHDGGAFNVALRDPRGGAFDRLGVFTLTGRNCVSTSGSYEKYFTRDGVRYHHIMDGGTGYPAESEFCSVTVCSKDGGLGDALSTACFVLTYEQSVALLQKYNCEGVFVQQDGQVICTPGLDGIFELDS